MSASLKVLLGTKPAPMIERLRTAEKIYHFIETEIFAYDGINFPLN